MSEQQPTTITPPQVTGYTSGANSPRDAAMMNQQNDASKLNSLINVTSGGRRMKKGGASAVSPTSNQYTVSVVEPLYKDPMAGSQSAENQQVTNAATFNQGGANAMYDSAVATPTPIPASQLKGGRGRRSRRINQENYNLIMKPVLDRNHDGVVSKKELIYAINTLLKANRKNRSSKYPSVYDKRIMMDVLDTNSDGVISRTEVDYAIDTLLRANRSKGHSYLPTPYDNRIMKDILDTNRDGVVSKKEMDFAIDTLMKANSRRGKTFLPSAYDNRIMKDVLDTNHDGVVSKKEMEHAINILKSTKKRLGKTVKRKKVRSLRKSRKSRK